MARLVVARAAASGARHRFRCAPTNGVVDVYGRGIDNHLYYRQTGAATTDWASLGGSVTAAPAAGQIYNQTFTTEVLTRSELGTLRRVRMERHSAPTFEDVGGNFIGAPAALTALDGSSFNLDAFVKATDGTLTHRSEALNTWARVDGTQLASSPTAGWWARAAPLSSPASAPSCGR